MPGIVRIEEHVEGRRIEEDADARGVGHPLGGDVLRDLARGRQVASG
jgi:hypothetical protein